MNFFVLLPNPLFFLLSTIFCSPMSKLSYIRNYPFAWKIFDRKDSFLLDFITFSRLILSLQRSEECFRSSCPSSKRFHYFVSGHLIQEIVAPRIKGVLRDLDSKILNSRIWSERRG